MNKRKIAIALASAGLALFAAWGGTDVYLLIGQSNMAGRGRLNETNAVPCEGVLKLDNFGYLVPAKEPLHNDRKSAGAGLGASFANAMRADDANTTVVLVPCAFGGSALKEWQKGSYMYEQAVLRTKEALRLLAAKDGRLAGILWHQGESDSGSEDRANSYAKRFSEMVRNLRQDLGCGDVPLVVGELGRYLADNRAKSGRYQHFEKINDALNGLTNSIPNCDCVSSEGLSPNSDILHFNTASLRTFGERYAAAMKGLMRNSGADRRTGFIRDVLSANPVRYDSEKMDTHAFDRAFAALAKADRAADAAWENLKDADAIAAYRASLKERMTAAVGGFPERTPLNVQVRGTAVRDGYRIEKLLFESRPRHFVTALLLVPDGVDAAHRAPGVVVTCGHNPNGKNSLNNQRAAVVLARHGFVTLIFDPVDQGERQQLAGSDVWSVTGHVNVGLRAHLVGWSTAQFRIWDGIRALDVLLERPEVDAARVGVTGMSGGGTMSSYLNALDDRYAAASPMGYITTLRALADRNGPQDMEQVVFGQLRDGINHLALLLMNGKSALAPGFSYGDLFPYGGSDETFGRAQAFFAREGRTDRIARIECDGPHDWYESEKQALSAWFRRWLADDATAWPPKADALERADVGFDYSTVDTGLAMTPETNVLGGKGVMSLPGARSVYDLVGEELDRLEKGRGPLSPELVRRTAGIAADVQATVLAATRREGDGFVAETAVLRMPAAARVIVRAFLPAEPKGVPVLLAADKADAAGEVAARLAEGRPVAVVTARAFGETYSHSRPHSYWAKKGIAEELSAFSAWMGRNFVAARAEDYLAAGAWFAAKTGRAAELAADGDAVVAAAHAYYLGRDRFASFALAQAPASWTEIVRNPALGHPHFCDLVYGGLAVYDWTDLIR